MVGAEVSTVHSIGGLVGTGTTGGSVGSTATGGLVAIDMDPISSVTATGASVTVAATGASVAATTTGESVAPIGAGVGSSVSISHGGCSSGQSFPSFLPQHFGRPSS